VWAGFVRYMAPPILVVVSFFSFGEVIDAVRALF